MGFRPEAAQIKAEGQIAGEVYASELYGAYTMLHASLNEHDLAHIRSDRMRAPTVASTTTAPRTASELNAPRSGGTASG